MLFLQNTNAYWKQQCILYKRCLSTTVVQLICNQQVVGSNPTDSLKARTAIDTMCHGFNPHISLIMRLAQLVEQWPERVTECLVFWSYSEMVITSACHAESPSSILGNSVKDVYCMFKISSGLLVRSQSVPILGTVTQMVEYEVW